MLPKEDSYSLLNQRQNYSGRNVDRYNGVLPDRAKEKSEFIKRIGDTLMPVERDILVLKYVYNEVDADIAKELGMITDTVIRIHNEALKKLKEILK